MLWICFLNLCFHFAGSLSRPFRNRGFEEKLQEKQRAREEAEAEDLCFFSFVFRKSYYYWSMR